MKSLFMTIVAAFAITASAVTYDEAVRLANTPIDQVTAENAESILSACTVVTNDSVIMKVAEKNLLPMSSYIDILGSNFRYASTLRSILIKYGTVEDQVAAVEPVVDSWIRASDEDKYKLNNFLIWTTIIMDGTNRVFLSTLDMDLVSRMCDKMANSGTRYAMNGIVDITCPWAQYKRTGFIIDRYYDQIVSAIKGDGFLPVYQFFDFAGYVIHVKKDSATLGEFIYDIKWYKPFPESSYLPYIAYTWKELEPEMSSTRRRFLNEVAESDGAFITVAKAQDKIDGNKLTTLSIYNKLTKADNKVGAAVYLDNADLLIDALMTVDSSVTPENMNDAIRVLNSLDPDYRSEDVKKALRVINKKYTIKLYDDRATWEPIISKVRALIDVY